MKERILKIDGQSIPLGEYLSIRLPKPKLFTYTPVDIPIHLNTIKNLTKGTLIAVPIVNIYGFIYQSHYLPDRHVTLTAIFPVFKWAL